MDGNGPHRRTYRVATFHQSHAGVPGTGVNERRGTHSNREGDGRKATREGRGVPPRRQGAIRRYPLVAAIDMADVCLWSSAETSSGRSYWACDRLWYMRRSHARPIGPMLPTVLNTGRLRLSAGYPRRFLSYQSRAGWPCSRAQARPCTTSVQLVLRMETSIVQIGVV